MGVDKNGPLPIYYQLKQLIRGKIAAGDWRPGQLIPSERELCLEHAISRMTVRQALQELVTEGVLRREQGKGTFVTQPKIEQPLGKLTSFTQDMLARGKAVRSQVLRQEEAPAQAEVAEALNVAAGTPVVLIERLRLTNGEPLALETCYLHFPFCQRLIGEDLANQSLYAVLDTRYGLVPYRALERIEAAIADGHLPALLDLHRGAAVLRMHRTSFDLTGRPFEHTLSVYRGDKYVFNVELIRE